METGAIYELGCAIPIPKIKLEGFSQSSDSKFLWGSFKGFSVFIFPNGRIRVVYSEDPAAVVSMEIKILTRIVTEVNGRLKCNINVDDVFSSKAPDAFSFFFEPSGETAGASALVAAYAASLQIEGDYKTGRLFELIGSLIGEQLVHVHNPSSPPELFSMLAEYFKSAGFGSMEIASSERLGIALYSLKFSKVPFAGFIQSRAMRTLIQNIVKAAYINFIGQLTVFVNIIKSWEQGDDSLVLELGLWNL